MKTLLLLAYYERPKIVRNALQSIIESTYTNWHLAACDDGSDSPLEPVVREMFTAEQLQKVSFYNTFDEKEVKNQRKESIYGTKINQAIRESNADLCVFICDDDALQRDYLEKLVEFYSNNPQVQYAHSQIILFNPIDEPFDTIKNRNAPSEYLNHGTNIINPFHMVDASQVSWRRSCNIEGGCWFPEMQTTNLDASFFIQLESKYGLCTGTGFIGQFKGWFDQQLGKRPNMWQGAE